MLILRRSMGVLFIIIALLVAIHTVVEPLYHVSTSQRPYSPFWDFINPLSALSIVIGLIYSYIRLCHSRTHTSVQEFIAANTLFYAFVFTAIIFFWNWFGIIDAGKEFTAIGSDTRTLVWILFDALLPPLNIAMGLYLLCAPREKLS